MNKKEPNKDTEQKTSKQINDERIICPQCHSYEVGVRGVCPKCGYCGG